MKILIIGFGSMGQTYAESFTNSGFVLPKNIFILNRRDVSLKNKFLIPSENYFTKPNKKIFEVDLIIISVKPQDFQSLSVSINKFVNSNHLILSIMAGISVESIKSKLTAQKIVRSMPNIATQIEQGVTVFCASSEIDRKELFIVQNLINTTGKSLYVTNEHMLNPATAISGSGPAYVYFFMNALINAAKKMGFSQSEASFLVNNTFLGAVQLQNKSNHSHQEWIDKVTSKGGTTEAAFNVFNNFEISNKIETAAIKANERANQLGKLFD